MTSQKPIPTNGKKQYCWSGWITTFFFSRNTCMQIKNRPKLSTVQDKTTYKLYCKCWTLN